MNSILVATDFFTRSDRALRRAVLIARRVGAALTLLHVVDADQPERLVASDRSETFALLDDAASTFRAQDAIAAEPLVVVGDVDSAILAGADEADAGLIILGAHRKRARDVFTGTVVERVLRRVQRPLLVATEPPAAPYRKSLLALDLDDASKAAGRAAVAMGILENTDVVVMHAFDTPGAGMMRRAGENGAVADYVQGERHVAVERLQDLAAEIGLPPAKRRVVALNGTPARAILETARSGGADLIVMGSNQRTGFERLLIGSVAEDVIREGVRDILIVPVTDS